MQGRAGQGRAGQGRARQGWSRQNRAVPERAEQWNAGQGWQSAPAPTPGGKLGCCTCAQVQGSTKLRKKMGLSSVAYKTIGTFPSQILRQEDATWQSTERRKTEVLQRNVATTAKQRPPGPTVIYTMISLTSGNASNPPPPPPGVTSDR